VSLRSRRVSFGGVVHTKPPLPSEVLPWQLLQMPRLGLPTSRFALREARSANNFALSRRPPKGEKEDEEEGEKERGPRSAKRE